MTTTANGQHSVLMYDERLQLSRDDVDNIRHKFVTVNL